ncbi:MAG: DUF3196 family protein [Erysipelotrichaceae bacterium]
MDSYYEEILLELAKLMQQEEYQEVYDILQDEFKMPYIPKESEEKMIALYNEVRPILHARNTSKVMDEETLEAQLHGNLEQALLAVGYLKEHNVRNYLDMIQAYLVKTPHYLIQSLLIELMIEQRINETFQIQLEGMDVDFIPAYVEMPMDADGAQACIQILRSFFENENPSFLAMCIDTLIKELYFRLPMNLEEDEALGVAVAIIGYVYRANDENQAFQAFVSKNLLDKYIGIDLLLSKHDN